MDPKLIRYYKKKAYGGRSVLARAIDLIMLRVIVFFFIFIVFLYLSLSVTIAFLISLFLTAAISISFVVYNRKKIEKYIMADIQRIKKKCLLEKLTFMGIDEYAEFIDKILDKKIKDKKFENENYSGIYGKYNAFVFHNHPRSECGINEILSVYRELKCDRLIIFSLSEFSEDVKNMCSRLPGEIMLIGGKEILEAADKKGLMPDESDAESDALKEVSETIVTLENIRNNALSKTKIKGYILCGIVIMLWPIVTGFEIYYPVIAMICFILALITYRKSKKSENHSIGIGIS